VVRLVHVSRCREKRVLQTFQSHRGSISTDSCDDRNNDNSRFQSHRGSISTSLACLDRQKAELSFNPTVVRLVPGHLDSSGQDSVCFNPTVVRLVLLTIASATYRDDEFQSHRGSISTLGMGSRIRCHLGFNPTVVRLVHVASCPAQTSAQRFNPTVVRLVPHPRTAAPNVQLPFQSHRGSISTPLWKVAREDLATVSIPPWFD
jgi:hypothetical protein